ncbi:hypothetical protein A9Q84_12080 [Halobacteriovorax marinus]|uniref:Uncharacterized protein n=1 Tax=Halobacteriovorax marinus TaxID=97084 RepID=A0A1Y5F854_9BACT|nr:hypothetical protein A9Q84_12080 [Halobacteriovorax marinus]
MIIEQAILVSFFPSLEFNTTIIIAKLSFMAKKFTRVFSYFLPIADSLTPVIIKLNNLFIVRGNMYGI